MTLGNRRCLKFQFQSNKMLQKSRVIGGLGTILVFLWVMSCGGGGSPSLVAPPKARVPEAQPPKTQATATPEAKPEAEFSYNPIGKPDPFKPFIQLTPVKGGTRKYPLTPLQRYEVSQLKLVAVISTPEGNIALVEDSAGKGFFLKKGTEIGSNDGKVKQILSEKVIVEEIYPDIFGQPGP